MAQYYVGVGGNDANDGLTWATRWATMAHAGAIAVVGDIVLNSAPSDYITPADVKAGTPDTTWLTAYDTLLAGLVTFASRAIDAFTHKRDGEWVASPTPNLRYFDGSGKIHQIIDPCTSVIEVAVDETGSGLYTVWVAGQDYFTWPYNPDVTSPITRLDLNVSLLTTNKPAWYRYQKSVRVNATWGWSNVAPGFIKQAALIQCTRWFGRAQQAYKDTGALPELHTMTYTQSIDPDIEALLTRKGVLGPRL